MKITRQDTNGVKPLLATGELGYDNYPAGGDAGRVYVGTGSANISQAKKSEVDAAVATTNAHTVRVDNPHSVTKAQVGLSNVDNTSDLNKPISTATQTALNTAVKLTGDQTIAGIKTFTSSPIVPTPTGNTQAANKNYVDIETTAAKAWSAITGKPTTYAPTAHTHPVGEVTGLGTAATMDVGTAYGNVMEVGAFGLGHTFPIAVLDANLIADQVGNKSGFYPYFSDIGSTNVPYTYVYIQQLFYYNNVTQIAYGYNIPATWVRCRYNGVWSPWEKNYNTFNTIKNPDGTIKASSPVINLYTDKHDLHNESQFGATPAVVRKSKGVYEITGTLGLRSEGWYLDTPSDRNGNKYFNIEWTQNITPDAVDGVVDEYRDNIVVTIETFERVWNKDTGLFENGNPVDINDLQNRFVQLRFNEIKVEQ